MQTILITTPLGGMFAEAEGDALRRLVFSDRLAPAADTEGEISPVLAETRRWVESYFAGKVPVDLPKLSPMGTPFQQLVWELLRLIPYGESVTYGQIAAQAEERTGRRTSPRAVGQAVGRNPICLMIPCHRVLGAGNAITGYAGGLERKRFLLRLEEISWRD